MSFAGRPAIGTLLATLTLGLIALARPSLATVNEAPEGKEDAEILSSELSALEQALRGYVAISFPAGRLNECHVRTLSNFNHRNSDAYRSWYVIRIESLCETGAAELSSGDPSLLFQQEDIWFLCSRRNEVTCAVTQPPNSL